MRYYFLALGTVVVVCVGCAMDGRQVHNGKGEYHAPPAQMLAQPGPMVGGPGPGVLAPMTPPAARPFNATTTQLSFMGPAGMRIGWLIPGGYAENQLVAPARYNFLQGQTYRLKLTNVPDRDGLTLYPTLQVYPGHPSTEAYLTHNSVPLQITVEDLDQVESNNFVTKVIYLPDAKFQELAIANVETLVSTRLDPGVDPVHEADKRGTIMAVLRIGNMDLEMPGPRGGQPGQPVTRADGQPIEQTAYTVDGDQGQHLPPLPIAAAGQNGPAIPGAMIVGGPGMPPTAGMNGMPMYGMPQTGTPIGLVGPPHIPYGQPASLKSHTVVNRTKMDLPKPVDHFRVDVKHEPGYSLPKPVKYVEYSEKHPVYSPGELSYPAWGNPNGQQGSPQGGAYCPPGQAPQQ